MGITVLVIALVLSTAAGAQSLDAALSSYKLTATAEMVTCQMEVELGINQSNVDAQIARLRGDLTSGSVSAPRPGCIATVRAHLTDKYKVLSSLVVSDTAKAALKEHFIAASIAMENFPTEIGEATRAAEMRRVAATQRIKEAWMRFDLEMATK